MPRALILLALGVAAGLAGYAHVQGAGPCTLHDAFAGMGLGVLGLILVIVGLVKWRAAKGSA